VYGSQRMSLESCLQTAIEYLDSQADFRKSLDDDLIFVDEHSTALLSLQRSLESHREELKSLKIKLEDLKTQRNSVYKHLN